MPLLSRLFASVPVLSPEVEEAPVRAISSDVILLIMLGVGIVLTIALVGFFAFVMWYESKRSGTNPEAKNDEGA